MCVVCVEFAHGNIDRTHMAYGHMNSMRRQNQCEHIYCLCYESMSLCSMRVERDARWVDCVTH